MKSTAQLFSRLGHKSYVVSREENEECTLLCRTCRFWVDDDKVQALRIFLAGYQQYVLIIMNSQFLSGSRAC